MATRKMLEAPRPAPGAAGLRAARHAALRMTAARDQKGGVVVYSPVAGISPEMMSCLEELGTVHAFLAPSQFHNLGIPEWSEAFPNTVRVAAEISIPRLKRQTGYDFEPLAALRSPLISRLSIMSAPGVKAGEAWI